MGSFRFEGTEASIQLRGGGDVWLGAEQVFSGRDLVGYKGDSCRATQQHFVECLLSGDEFETEVKDYLNTTVAAVEACYHAAAENRAVSIAEIARRRIIPYHSRSSRAFSDLSRNLQCRAQRCFC